MPTTSPGCTVVGSRTSRVSSTMCGAPKRAGVAAASTKSQRGVMTPTPKETWLGLTRCTRIEIGGSSRFRNGAEYTIPPSMRALRLFLVSFLVLFLQVALIRWMPAYVRLLAYFSNFILLAAFLGIGVGCLLTPDRASAVRLVRAPPGPGHRRRGLSSGWRWRCRPRPASISRAAPPRRWWWSRARCCCRWCSWSWRCCSRRWRSHGQAAGGPAAAPATPSTWPAASPAWSPSALMSWLELPPTAWFARRLRGRGAASSTRRWGWSAGSAMIVARSAARWSSCTACRGDTHLVAVLQDHRPSRKGRRPSSRSTTSSTSRWRRCAQKEYFYQWPYTVFGDSFEDVLILGAGSGTDVAAALLHGVEAHRRRRDRSGDRPARARAPSRSALLAIRASPSSPTTRGTSCGRRRRSTTWWCSR